MKMAHKHSVYDSDTHFSINPNTRVLNNEASSKTSLIQFDHNSERFTFEIPRYIEEHDMFECDVIQVHYNNIDAQTKAQSQGVYNVDDMQISPEDENVVILSWLISQNATQYVGSLNFLIRFSCTGEDGKASYVWNTAIYTGISVSSGIYNGGAVVEEYADILNEWKQQLEENMVVSLEQTQTSTQSSGVNIWTTTFADGRTYSFEVRNGEKGEKGDNLAYETETITTTHNGQNFTWLCHKHTDGMVECIGSGFTYFGGASFTTPKTISAFPLPMAMTNVVATGSMATSRDDTNLWLTFKTNDFYTATSTVNILYIGMTHDDVEPLCIHVVGKWK